uniref:Uncharacterized protein n=1 Tax=Entomoneis paludosa TaxID=265537 RepID=A0A7S2VB98_9STRA|mmetsp:Transcript_15499/g.32038  ORF Transcript_15499/g.32038 Transcript_15499/m.32038 type:complete len:640 (+) Transcript_15499:171-2090(+)
MKLGLNLALVASLWSCATSFVPFAGHSSRVSLSKALIQHEATLPQEDTKNAARVSEPDMKAYASGYTTVFDEVPCRVCKPSHGTIPSDLKGSYFRCGPAMFSAGSIVPPKTSIIQPKNQPVPDGQDPSRMVRHPFDADGAVLGISFGGEGDDPNQATVRYRYVRTTALINERKKGEKRYTAMESTREMGSECAMGLGNEWQLPLYRHHLQPGLNKMRKNTSNTRTIYWGKRLLSMWEGGQPYKLDALALSTEGRSRLGGAIRRDDDPFGSKMVIDSKANKALFYGLEQGSKQSELTLYEFGDDFRMVENGRTYFPLPGFAVVNDFAATENYAVVVQPPMSTNGMQFILKKEPGLVTSLDKGSSLLHLIPRTSSAKSPLTISIPMDDGVDANLQFINAYESPRDPSVVIFDAIRPDHTIASGKPLPEWPWVDTLEKYQSGATSKSLWRYTVDTKAGKVTKEPLFGANCAFGGINAAAVSAQQHRFIYMNVGGSGSNAPPQGLARLDCETGSIESWMPAKHEFCGEPMFAAKEGGTAEDDGYILSVILDGERQESDLVVLDAKQIGAGPVARVPLGSLVPHGLFGCYAPNETWPSEVIERRAKLSNKMESRGDIWNEVKSDFSGLGLRLDDIDEYFPGLFG